MKPSAINYLSYSFSFYEETFNESNWNFLKISVWKQVKIQNSILQSLH